MQTTEQLTSKLAELNPLLASLDLPQIEAVAPTACIPQEVNARYMPPEMMANLTKNLKQDKRLESLPLCYRIEGKPGMFGIISGHHRIEGAKQAELPIILILVIDISNKAEIVKKQLSHNALNGRDDEVLLSQLFATLATMDDKYYAGLQDELAKITPISLSFRAGLSAEMSLIFMPEDIELTEQTLQRLNVEVRASGSGPVAHVLAKSCYEEFTTALKKLKRLENIKNNAAAFVQLVIYARERMDQIAAEKVQEQAEAPET